jgi:hypothetical protein
MNDKRLAGKRVLKANFVAPANLGKIAVLG